VGEKKIYNSSREIYIFLFDLCISSGEIYISFPDLCKCAKGICIPLGELYKRTGKTRRRAGPTKREIENWKTSMNWTFALPLLLAAFGFGVAHAFEPDHMAAVSTFVAGRPKPREAALFGVRWAVGHGLSLFLIGSALFLVRRAAEKSQPQLFASGVLDRFVGLILVGLGIWTLFQVVSSRASKTHAHGHFHDGQLHSHEGGEGHSHGAHGHSHPGGLASLGMGVLHGAAGTGAFIGQAAVSLSTSYAFVFLYTLLFSVGVLLSMGTYAGALGGLITTFEKRGEQALGIARIITAVLTCAIGVCLLSGIELPGLFDHFVHQ